MLIFKQNVDLDGYCLYDLADSQFEPVMDTSTIEQALRALGTSFSYHTDVEILLVGGAAGMLTGQFAPGRQTTDCDVMVYVPEGAMAAVERAADEVAKSLGLTADWFNSKVQLRMDALPDGWRKRRILVGVWGQLTVFAASRIDLIAMKVLAGRVQDRDDILAMKLRSDDIPFVNEFLDGLPTKGTSPAQVAEARAFLATLKVDDRE